MTQTASADETKNQESAVLDRYSQGAQLKEEALCCPVSYDPSLLKAIPEEILDKVFERGFTTSKEGSGLGLYITKKLCNAHKWNIVLEVTDVTMFHIKIPKIPVGS